ncbi:Helix-turn-helix [Arboricoccus pini]|uniref:Helix-turn-helix n=1 Tax=Arboricoccus pini TaxID=1963835 RepID=A0A212QMS7_9PROT|nr:helix-turn-helix transcriptional regulator [Arboricoccus pini]SNB60700.1 Helix-turn-helix [Arboricoccus pini]
MNKRVMVRLFRERLIQVLEKSELSQTAFAERVQIDRSTLSQLLAPGNERLPRMESVIGIATSFQVSLDWLFGLSQRDGLGADVLHESLQVESDALSHLDERLLRWHREAAGYKIRHVPASFPDVLKTDDVIRFEYGLSAVPTPERRIGITQSRLDYLREPDTEMETAMPFQTMESFARGEGGWQGLDRSLRREQILHAMSLVDELYPRFRWFLYDGRQDFSAPVTVFGPQRAAIYIGRNYFVFRSTEHIRILAQHVDRLIRAATITATRTRPWLESLLPLVR